LSVLTIGVSCILIRLVAALHWPYRALFVVHAPGGWNVDRTAKLEGKI